MSFFRSIVDLATSVAEAIDAFVEWCTERHRSVALGLACCGVLCVAIAALIHIDIVPFNGVIEGGGNDIFAASKAPFVKETGYAIAPSWALATSILLPLALFYLLRTRSMVRPLRKYLVDNEMLVREADESLVQLASIDEVFGRERKRFVLFAALGFLLTLLFVEFLYYASVFERNLVQPLGTGGEVEAFRILETATQTFDWTIAGRLQNPRVDELQVVLFGFAAYALLAIELALAFFLLIWLLALQAIIRPETRRGKSYLLVPNRQREPNRLGFGEVDKLLVTMLLGVFSLTLVVVFMHLNEIYLRTPDQANPWSMMFEDVVAAAVSIGSLKFGEIPGAIWNTIIGSKALKANTSISIGIVFLFVYASLLSLLAVSLGWSFYTRGKSAVMDLRQKYAGHLGWTRALDEMQLIPGGKTAVALIVSIAVLLAGSAIWLNFVGFALILALVVVIYSVINYVRVLFS